jgi:excinuclease UvrABC ATPase subunit
MELDRIIITGARQHNLKHVTVEIPKKKLVVITGPSGSGKSSLAFDTLYAEGQHRYIESLSACARHPERAVPVTQAKDLAGRARRLARGAQLAC